MTFFSQLWQRLGRAARVSLIFSLILLAAVTVGISIWLLRPDYQVLFGDLAPADAAAMAAELDRMKIPYRLEGDGNTIMVPAEQVYKTRLKLVGRDLPLHGTVGFELFNNADIGMTEFAQKVNYQRALQGELTRTILSYEEIQAARVHLALPEQSLFKKANSQAKASVSLTLKPGAVLQPHEVQGIQRLVAASVPDIREQDVTVIDQHGVALTHATAGEGESDDSGAANLDNKQALERYLTRKVSDVLDRSFGSGQSIASVDVVFNRNAVKTTTENVLGANGNGAAGVMTHEHQTGHDAQAALPEVSSAGAAAAAPQAGPNGGTREVDYQVGRRVEQVVSAPGGIEKINVAVVVRQSLETDQIDRIRDIVSVAAGIDKARGDGVAVYTMGQFGATPNATMSTIVSRTDAERSMDSKPDLAMRRIVDSHTQSQEVPVRTIIYILAGLIIFVALVAFIWQRQQGSTAPMTLAPQERAAMLARVRDWLDAEPDRHGDPA